MATIHRAIDTRTDRPVAIKLLRPEIGADPDLAQRFRREALASTVLRHPNIVGCLDTGTDGDQPYLVMELVHGEDLAARLRRGGRLAPEQAARIGLDVARAIGAAHLRGIVHRDIKPGNILLASDGRAMVADFGIARLAADAESNLPGTTLGSVHYFSPEQARGLSTTPASDVYGVGLLMYEALTGQRAWSGDTTDAIVLARVGAPEPSPRTLRPEISRALDAVVVRALAPEPTDRYPNGGALAAALEAAMASEDQGTATTRIKVPAAAVAAPSARASRAATSGPPPRPGPRTKGATPRAKRPARAGRSAADARRAFRPVILVALLALLGVAGGAAAVASFSGNKGVALEATPTPTPRATPRPTPTPTPRPTPTRTPVPSPTQTTAPTDLLPGEVGQLCEIFLDVPCGLGAGRYAINDVQPSFTVDLGDGWSAATRRADLVALSRPEGMVTFASGVQALGSDGKPTESQGQARDLVSAFSGLKGVGSTKASNVKIDGQRGRSIDLTPSNGKRIALFKTGDTTYSLEADRTTRIVALDTDNGVLLIAIEPAAGAALRDVLQTADPVAGSIRFQ